MEINALSPHKHMLISGTARDKGDQFDQIWENSDKREWFVQCQSCGAKQQLIFDNIMGPEGQKYKGCRLCKKPLDVRKGKWRPTKDPATSYYVGYHMNQIMHPTITANEIYLKYEMYQSERLFYNEVLGEPYSGGLRPIPIDRILACTSTSHSLLLPREYFDDKPCFLGMDCGLGNHLIIIDENLTWKHLDIIRLKDFSSFDAMIDYIVLLIRSFNVSNAVVDWGDGRNEVTSLQKILGSLVKGCEYKLVDPNDPVHYLETDKSGDYIHRYHADRSATLEKVFWNFKEREFTIPYDQLSRPKVEEFFDHFTNIISNLPDLIENRGKIRAKDSSVLYGATGPDHMCHALNYALIARNMAEDQSISFSKIV